MATSTVVVASTPVPVSENRIYYPALDGLRAMAALMVFFEHYLKSVIPVALRWGWTGVDIFFVLSGFLITGILLDTVDAPNRLRNFYVRRSLRIFPVYYAVLGIVLLSTPILHWQWNRLWLLWPLYVGNYGPILGSLGPVWNFNVINDLYSARLGLSFHFAHLWSLCVEEQFYLVWPFLVFAMRRVSTVRSVCIAMIFLVPAVRLVSYFYLPQMWISGSIFYKASFFRFDSFMIGGLIACLFREGYAHRLRARAGTIFAGALTLLIAACAVAAGLLHQSLQGGAWMKTIGYTLVAFVAAGVLLMALNPGSALYKVLSLRPLQRLGQVSYGFYILHDIPRELYARIVQILFRGHGLHAGYLIAPLGLVCTAALAFLSFRYLETPFLRLKSRFTVQ